ncbi:MAG: polyprenyl synthetase family protein [Elusimicrobiota bacterium]
MAGHRAVSTETPLGLEEALARVRAGIERRVALLGARVGDALARHVGRPGKMLRSRYALALGSALGVPESVSENAARAVEIVHNASLLHDDCVDKAAIRRGSATPNGLFGQTSGILLGDLAFAEGLEEAMEISPSAARELVGAVREMAVGELQEEFLGGSLRVSVEAARRWFERLRCVKRSVLFPGCYHELHHEPVRDEVLQLVHDWTLADG